VGSRLPAPGSSMIVVPAAIGHSPASVDVIGWDRTTGPSGACGINKWLNITMPLTLTLAG
jgi:hypothetical protein